MEYINKTQTILIIILFTIMFGRISSAQTNNLAEKLTGRILLQVESLGEAWYINPVNYSRYYLGRPADAFIIMRKFGVGITNNNLNKIAIGMIDESYKNQDSDGDGYNDYEEIINDYNANGIGKLQIDENFSNASAGKIFLQIEKNGEAWYVNPVDNKRYFLGRPADAYAIMRELGLGINNENIEKISINIINTPSQQKPIPLTNPSPEKLDKITTAQKAIDGAANAIRSKDSSQVLKYFVPEMEKSIILNMESMSDESILALGNILSGSEIANTNNSEVVYSNNVYFGLADQDIKFEFTIKKQENGEWLMTNL